jgi:hypothetical protein
MLFRLTAKGEKKLSEMDVCTEELPDELKRYIE